MTPARANWLFLRLLGLVYVIAFLSLMVQVTGLIGAHGILPARAYMDAARAFVASEHIGIDRYRLLPTLCWIDASDQFLRALCLAGAVLGGLLTIGVLPALAAPLLWIDYLSLSAVAREFLSYQWDALGFERLPLQTRLGREFVPALALSNDSTVVNGSPFWIW